METPSIDEDARRKFEAAWASRKPISIEDCLPPHDSAAWLPTVEELALIELELGWKANRHDGPVVEDYLTRFPQLLRADILLRLIQEEHDVRQRFGDRPSRHDYVKRFPDVILTGDELRPVHTLPLASVPISPQAETRITPDSERAASSAPAAKDGEQPADGHALVESLSHQAEGRSRYTLTRLHAEGGLGRVWIARDADLNRDVALKELKPSPANHPETARRFVKEAQVTGQLEHPNIVPVYELGHRSEDNQPYYTMRFVHGQTLRDAVAEYHRQLRSGHDDPVEWLRLLQAFVSICNAVSYAHSRGVIHRDLKPDNVLLGAFGEVLVLDWGLAKTGDTKDEHLTPIDVSEKASLHTTLSGRILGTPAYMAPEQAEGLVELVDERTDVYGLGAILFEILTGRPPHLYGDTADIIGQIIRDPTPPPRSVNSATPRALEAVCAAAMAKERSRRYPAAEELARDIQRYLADEPVSVYREPLLARAGRFVRHHRTKVAFATAAALVALISGAIGLFLLIQSRQRDFQETELRMGRVTTTVTAERDLVLRELRQDNFGPIEDLLPRTIERLTNDRNKADVDARPAMVQLRNEVTALYDRLHRIAQFYQLVDGAARSGFFAEDEQAERQCLAAVNLFGGLTDPKWFDHLPADDLTPSQHERLQEEVFRQLLFLSAMRVQRGLMNLGDPKNADTYRSALDAVAAANRWKPSESARLLEVSCRVGLKLAEIAKPPFDSLPAVIGRLGIEIGNLAGIGQAKPMEPTCAADFYFLGIIHFWVSQRSGDAASMFLKATQPITRIDFSNSLEKSERLLRRAASMEPEHYWTYFWLGWNRLAAERFSAAELAFDTCIALQPDNALGFAYRGWSLLLESQSIKDATTQSELRTRGLADLARARGIEPANSEFAWLTGLALAQSDQTREALQAFLRAAELEPVVSTWTGRRIYDQKLAYFKRMRELAKSTTETDPRNPGGWTARASAAWALGSLDEAEQAAAAALKLKNDQPVALAVRGSVSLARKRFDAALSDFRAALAKQPKLWLAADGLAQALESQAPADQALDAYDDLTVIAETNFQKAQAQLGRARLLARLNRPDEATAARKLATATDPAAK
jgi:tetratricopeptide (TPR) repeat protein/tRNA A-37 threonylcarbamoyl transferase component Bud32